MSEPASRSRSTTGPASAGSVGCTCFALRRLTRRISLIYDRALQPAGLKTTQFSMLRALRHGPRAMGEFAELIGLERSTLTRNAAPLIEAGWLRQRAAGAGEADPRARLLELTPAGETVLTQATPLWRRAQQQVRELMGDDELLSLHGVIDHAMARLPRDD